MNALEYHIIFAVSFAVCLLITVFNQIRLIKNLDTDNPFKGFAVTAVFSVLSSIFAFASISALLIHLFGK
jgi:hypothetical protein